MGISLAEDNELAPDLAPLDRPSKTTDPNVGTFGCHMVPAGIRAIIVERLAAETEKALGTAKLKQRNAQIGFHVQHR